MKWLLALCLVGCSSTGQGSPDLAPGPSATLRLTVTTQAQLTTVDHLVVTVEVGGVKNTLQLVAGPLPPSQTFELKILTAGTANVTVEAQDTGNKAVGRGSGSVDVTLLQTVDLTVSLLAV